MDKFEIQTDFESNEFSEIASLFEPGTFIEAAKEINKSRLANGLTKEDLRPRAVDRKGMVFLVDTGAAVSCYPVHKVKNPVIDPNLTLKAVNGSVIETYGKKTVKFELGALSFTHTFIVAKIRHGVLGWDYMRKFQLDIRW